MYSKAETPINNDEIPRYLDGELKKLESESLAPEVESLSYTIMYDLPDKPRAGQTYYADGTSWNPGSGEGIYRYSIGGAWVLVG